MNNEREDVNMTEGDMPAMAHPGNHEGEHAATMKGDLPETNQGEPVIGAELHAKS